MRIPKLYRFRSAVTGLFVSLAHAIKHPRESVRERVADQRLIEQQRAANLRAAKARAPK